MADCEGVVHADSVDHQSRIHECEIPLQEIDTLADSIHCARCIDPLEIGGVEIRDELIAQLALMIKLRSLQIKNLLFGKEAANG